eukprot:51268-Eustigmatos_ZCMA.PRE.1
MRSDTTATRPTGRATTTQAQATLPRSLTCYAIATEYSALGCGRWESWLMPGCRSVDRRNRASGITAVD